MRSFSPSRKSHRASGRWNWGAPSSLYQTGRYSGKDCVQPYGFLHRLQSLHVKRVFPLLNVPSSFKLTDRHLWHLLWVRLFRVDSNDSIILYSLPVTAVNPHLSSSNRFEGDVFVKLSLVVTVNSLRS